MAKTEWETKIKKLADVQIVAATPNGTYNFLNDRIVITYTGTIAATFNISVKEV